MKIPDSPYRLHRTYPHSQFNTPFFIIWHLEPLGKSWITGFKFTRNTECGKTTYIHDSSRANLFGKYILALKLLKYHYDN